METDILTALPRELFCKIMENLTNKRDIKALSLASKTTNLAVSQHLWEHMALRPQSEKRLYHFFNPDSLPKGYVNTRELTFRSNAIDIIPSRCPHHQDRVDPWVTDDDDDEGVDRWVRMSEKVLSILREFEPGQLRGFSWDMGVCLPDRILGPRGIVGQNHPELEALHLTTASHCKGSFESDIDLSKFHHLKHLSWRAPSGHDIATLSQGISQNAAHLQSLSLEFPDARDIIRFLAARGAWTTRNIDLSLEKNPSFFARNVLQMENCLTGSLFPSLQALTLTNVPLEAGLARYLDLSNLPNVTLRHCPGWTAFLREASTMRRAIGLKSLEVQSIIDEETGVAAEVIGALLGSFSGLEELYLYFHEDIYVNILTRWPVFQFWQHLLCHRSTLKKFMHHQRGNFSEGVSIPGDVASFALFGRLPERPDDDWNHHPLAALDLEALAITSLPELLKPLFLPISSKPSLKIIHIRQSACDMPNFGSWGSGGNGRTPTNLMLPYRVHIEGPVGRSQGPDIRSELVQFANWAFGEHGLPALEAVAFGDFTSDFSEWNNIIMCRATDGGSQTFRLLHEEDAEWQDVIERHSRILLACPTTRFNESSSGWRLRRMG